MKTKFVLTLLLGSALTASAYGFKDGVEYFRADQPEEAAMILTNNLDATTGTDKATAYYYLGQVALLEGDKTQAKANFDAGLAADAANPYNYIGLGALDLASGNAQAAAAQFKTAKGYAKKNADVLTEIARAYFNADPVKYVKEIDKYLADAKKAQKNHPAPFILEGDRVAKTNVGEAAGMYEMAAQFDTANEHPEAYVKYARTYFSVNPGYAIQKVRDLLAQQPNSALAQRELAEKLYDDNQLTRAAEQYGEYIKNPNHFKKDEQRYVGLLYFGKKYQDSYDLAGKLLAEDPTNFYMQRMQFYNLKALEQDEAALAAAEKLLANPKTQVEPNDYVMYGEVLTKLKQDTAAVDMYEKAVALAPTKTALLKELSAAYSTAQMYEKSAEAMQKYIDAGEGDANDLLMLANRYKNLAISTLESDSVASSANAAKALATINQVIEKVPGNPMVLNTKSDIIRLGAKGFVTPEVIEADNVTLACLDSDPANLEKRKNIYESIYSRLGRYYLQTKDMENAKLYFNKYYEVSPSDELRAFIDGLQ